MRFADYLASNIPLFSVSLVMIFIAFRNINVRRKESILFLVFTTIVLFLSGVVFLEKYSQTYGLPILGTIFTSFGYICRPILLYIFVLLANMEQKRKRRFYVLLTVPLIINSLVYFIPWFFGVPGMSTIVFSYQMQPDGTADFVRGSFLNFTSHAICVIYIILLIYVSTVRFQGKHRRDGVVLILCMVIIVATVVAEMVLDRSDLLNIVCEICAMINYIFIMSVNASKDPLTGLYDRRTFNEDVSKYKDIINGVILIDMNELKFVNDNFGHQAGDTALKFISSCFEESIDPAIMCSYRLSGDEFLILMFKGKKEQLEDTANKISSRIKESKYSIALGSYYSEGENIGFDQMMKIAEDLMYQDKGRYYEESGHNRRGN